MKQYLNQIFTLVFLLTATVSFSQFRINEYFGYYSSVYRLIDSINTPEQISDNGVKVIDVYSELHNDLKIQYATTYDSLGQKEKTKFKGKWYRNNTVNWKKQQSSKKTRKVQATYSDSILNGNIIGRKCNNTFESYEYDNKGNLVKIKIDYDGISTMSRVCEVDLEYNTNNKVVKERIIKTAGDSVLVINIFQDKNVVETEIRRYEPEQVLLGNNKYSWQISPKGVEKLRYYYLKNGLLDYICLTKDGVERFEHYKYK